jgi:NAD(P)-dependent dehydrogenase (short-subunit alcohol dehydrogenase family)
MPCYRGTPGVSKQSQVCIVTGGAGAIGAATARLAGRQHFAVAVNYLHNETGAKAVVDDIVRAGGRAVAIRADVSRPEDVAGLFERTAAELGPPTALVNNAAAFGSRQSITHLDPDALQRVLSVNLGGPLLCIAEAARRMSTQHGGDGGAIVNVSSLSAQTGGRLLTPYVASKAGLEAITIGLARELGPQGIRVNAVRPGVIATEGQPLEDAAWVTRTVDTIPLGRLGTAVEVAETILWLLSPAAAYVSGAVIAVTGGR